MTSGETIIRKHADQVLWIMIRELIEHHADLVTLAVDRYNGTGAREHGDSITRKTPTELRTDRFEEHADAFVYGAHELEHQRRE